MTSDIWRFGTRTMTAIIITLNLLVYFNNWEWTAHLHTIGLFQQRSSDSSGHHRDEQDQEVKIWNFPCVWPLRMAQTARIRMQEKMLPLLLSTAIPGWRIHTNQQLILSCSWFVKWGRWLSISQKSDFACR